MAAPTFATGDVPTAAQVNDWFVNTKFVRKTANTNRSSTVTLTDDPDLVIGSGVAANSVYEARVQLLTQSPTAADFQCQLLGPSGSTFAGITQTISSPSGSLYTDDNTYPASFGTPLTAAGITGTPVPMLITGLIVTAGSSGSFKVQWAQGTSNASSTTLFANSYIFLRRLS